MATGAGFTVIVTVIAVPAHPAAVGVTVYVAVPAEAPVAVNVWAIVEPLPAEAPLTPDCVTVHAKVVPAIVLLRFTAVAEPEQIVWEDGVAVATGSGLMTIVLEKEQTAGLVTEFVTV